MEVLGTEALRERKENLGAQDAIQLEEQEGFDYEAVGPPPSPAAVEPLVEEEPEPEPTPFFPPHSNATIAGLWGPGRAAEFEGMGYGEIYHGGRKASSDPDGFDRFMNRKVALTNEGYTSEEIQSGYAKQAFLASNNLPFQDDVEFDRTLKSHAERKVVLEEKTEVGHEAGINAVTNPTDGDLSGATDYAKAVEGVTNPEEIDRITKAFIAPREALLPFQEWFPMAQEMMKAVEEGKIHDIDVSAENLVKFGETKEPTKLFQAVSILMARSGRKQGAGTVEEIAKAINRGNKGILRTSGQFFNRNAELQRDDLINAESISVREEITDMLKAVEGDWRKGALLRPTSDRRSTHASKDSTLEGAEGYRLLTDKEEKEVKEMLLAQKGYTRLVRQMGNLTEVMDPILNDNIYQKAARVMIDSGQQMILSLNPLSLATMVLPQFTEQIESELELTAPHLTALERKRISTPAGITKTLIARMQAMTLFMKVPKLSAYAQGLVGGKYLDIGARTITNLGAETIQEYVEDQSTNVVLSVANLFDENMPDAGYRETHDMFVENLGPMTLGMFPLVFLGAVGSTNVNARIAKKLEPHLGFNMLQLGGLTPTEAQVVRDTREGRRATKAAELLEVKTKEEKRAAMTAAAANPDVISGTKSELMANMSGGVDVEGLEREAARKVDPAGDPAATVAEGEAASAIREPEAPAPTTPTGPGEGNAMGAVAAGQQYAEDVAEVEAEGQKPHKFVPRVAAALGLALDTDLTHYTPISPTANIDAVRANVQKTGPVAMAELFEKGLLPDGTRWAQELTPQQAVTLGNVLLDELSNLSATARAKAQVETNLEAKKEISEVEYQLAELIHNMVDTVADLGLNLGRGVQAFTVWSYLRPDDIIKRIDEKLKKKNKDLQTAEGAAKVEEGTKKQAEDAEENEKKTKKKTKDSEKAVTDWIESIDKDVKGEETEAGREMRNRPPHTRPTSDNETVKSVVARFTNGSAMTVETLEEELARYGLTEEQVAEGSLRAQNLKKARQDEASAKALKKYLEAAIKRDAQILKTAKKAAERAKLKRDANRWGRAEKFVQSIWATKKAKKDQSPTGKLTAKDLITEFKTSVMSETTLRGRLREFQDESGERFFNDAQVEEAIIRATVEKAEINDDVVMRDMRKAAREYVQSVQDQMGRKSFELAFGKMDTIKAKIKAATQVEELHNVLEEGGGLTPEQKVKIRELSQASRDAPADSSVRSTKSKELVNYLYGVEGVKAMDVITSYWYANILSGVNTQGINIFGSGLHTGLRTFSAMVVDVVTHRDGKGVAAMARGMWEAISSGQAWNEAMSALLDGRDPKKLISKTVVAPNTLEVIGNPDNRFQDLHKVIKKLVTQSGTKAELKKNAGEVLSYWKFVFQALVAGDIFFYRTAYEGRAALAASRVTRPADTVGDESMEGETAAQYAKRLKENKGPTAENVAGLIARNMHDSANVMEQAMAQATEEVEKAFPDGDPATMKRDIMKRAFEIIDQARSGDVRQSAHRFGLLSTYTNKPGGLMGELATLVNYMNMNFVIETKHGDISITRPLVPFVNIVANVANAALDFSPYGIVKGLKRGHLIGRDTEVLNQQESNEIIASGVIGSSVVAVLWGMANSYLDDDDPLIAIYGMGPTDKAFRKQKRAQGWQPYTLKIGGMHWNYTETPLVMTLGFIGALHDKHRYDPRFSEKGNTERLSILLMLAARAYSEPGFMSGVKDLIGLLSGETRAGNVFTPATRAASGLIPGKGFMRDLITRPFDRTMIETDTLWATFIKGVPFAQHWGTGQMINGFAEMVSWNFFSIKAAPVFSRFGSGRVSGAEWQWLAETGLELYQPQSIAVGSSGLTDWERSSVKMIKEIRMREMGRYAYNVFSDEEKYKLQMRVGPRVKSLIAGLMGNAPGSFDKEEMQERIKDLTKEIIREEKMSMLRERYPQAF